MSALASDPREFLQRDRVATRSVVTMHTARALAIEPEQFGDLTIGEVLHPRIPYLSRERASQWLAEGSINPWRLARELRHHQRVYLARTLAQYAKEGER